MTRPLALVAPALLGALALAAEPSDVGSDERSAEPTADACAGIEDDAQRLACWDAQAAARVALGPQPPPRTFIEHHWDLYDEARPFQPWPHRPTYVLPARWTSDVNELPTGVVEPVQGEPIDVQSVEAKFQVSVKTKLVRNLLGSTGDLWFGYTQQSHFQVYNASDSRPFRETDFEPEALLTFPARRRLGAWTLRMVGAGFVHQSNGRSAPLSRSWNRAYVLAAIERKNLVFHVRPWSRVSEGTDDNPGITDLVGRMDVLTQWSVRHHVLTVRGRSNLDTQQHKGSLETNWFFPIHESLRGQFQAFTGYGESLIDYDHSQTTFGIGLLAFDPF